MCNHPSHPETTPAESNKVSEALRRLLRLLAREVVRRLKAEQTAAKESADGPSQQ
jgi:hypothetical protein